MILKVPLINSFSHCSNLFNLLLSVVWVRLSSLATLLVKYDLRFLLRNNLYQMRQDLSGTDTILNVKGEL